MRRGVFLRKDNMNFKNKKIRNIFALILLALFFVFIPNNIVYAGDENRIAQFLSHVVLFFADAFGYILTLILGILSKVFTWQDFGNEGVTMGWTTVRDLCNMAFILMLLVIAFSTILRYENYNWKKTLPKLLMMAVLINFSKTITLLLIDFSQIIMLTFANAFAGTPGNFVNALGLQYLKSIDASKIANVNDWHIFYAAILALVVIVISICIMTMMTAMLVMRMVMLWILIVLSPLAFLDYAISNKYFSQWSGELTKYLTSGPILAFFVWLSLSILDQTGGIMQKMETGMTNLNTATEFGSWDIVSNFILAIGLLVGAMKITSSMGVMGGNIGMNMANSLKSKGLGLLKAGGGKIWKTAKTVGKEGGGFLVDQASLKLGMGDLNLARGYGRLKAQWAKNKKDRVARVEQKMAQDIGESGAIRANIAMALTGNLGWEELKNFFTLGQKEKRDNQGNIIQERKEWGFKEVSARAMMRGRRYNKELEGKEEIIKEAKNDKEKYISSDDHKTKAKRLDFLDNKHNKNTQEAGEIIAKISVTQLDIANAPDIEKKEKAEERLSDLQSQLVIKMLKEKEIEDEELNIKSELGTKKRITNDQMKTKDDEINKLQKEKKDFMARHGTPELVGLTAGAFAKIEGEGAKEISHIDNPEQLAIMFKGAIKNQKMELATAIAKKMAKAGNYNELQKHLGFGTGLKGMHQLGEKLQSAGMSQQAAFGVLADLGETTKNLGQFGGFATVTMENGKFRKATDDEYETAKLAEMMKMQPQEFARKVNRLGLGSYEPVNEGDSHGFDNWQLSRAAAAYIKMNGNALGKQYNETGQLNAMQHLAHEMMMLRRNGITETMEKDNIIHVITTRGGETQSGPMERIRSTRR